MRRQTRWWRWSGLTALAAAATLLLGAPDAVAQKKGGVVRIANLGEPPTLDAHWTTATLTEVLTNHLYEGLYALDEGYRPIPMLADGMPTVSADGLTYSIKLRQGIKFHNGKEMTSEDVVASLKRWMQQGQYGRALATVTADVRATGKYAIEIKLKQKYAAVEVCLAAPNNFGAIYPKEIAEKFPPAEKVTEFVGTGPYKLAEWKPDQHIRMVRFDDYKSLPGKVNGYGGAKTVWVDEIRWIPVPDVATRVAQMETGELEFADDLNIDAFDRLQKSTNARPVVAKPYYWLVAVLNKKEGLMTNQKLRQAWQAAIDIEPIMKAVAGGRSEFYRMGEPGLAFVENAPWYVKPNPAWGWNERNKEKAKKLMQEAGYKGEPVRFVTTQEYKWMYDFALVTKQQLEDVGFNIDLQVVDWATLVKRRNNPKEYEAFTTGTGNIFEPTAYTVLSCTWPGWTCDADIQGLLQEMTKETEPKKRFALWEQMHKLWYEKVPSIRYGDLHGLRAASKKLQGFNDKTERPRFYNVWLDR
jgi:peptide/nickel transport system substrate-binding protein